MTTSQSPQSPQPAAPPAPLDNLLLLFATAPAIWYSSVRPDGRAHLAPIWHVWDGHAAYVVTQATAVRARNLAHNRSVSLALPDAINPFIIEGNAAIAPDAVETIQPLFQSKYDWDIRTDAEYDCIIRVTPTKAMAWGSHGEGRWHYDASAGLWLARGAE